VGRRLLARADGSAVLAVVVADGHGDSRHFRSGRGSAMAVAAGLAAVEAWTTPVTGGADAVQDSAGRKLVTGIVTRWNAAVAADLSADPFSDAERTVLARLSLPDVIAYGSTLLVAAFTSEFAVFTQIGDGDIVAVLPDGQSLSAVPADDSLDGWQTTSLCQPDAGAAFRTGVVLLADCPLFAVLLASDGFGNAQADDPWPPGFAADLVQLGLEHEPGWFAGQLPGWAKQCASVDGSGDDCTMALVISSTVVPGPEAQRDAQEAGRHSRTEPARTVEFSSPVARPRSAPASQPWPDQAAARSGQVGSGHGFIQQLRPRLLWVAAAIAVILGGIALAFVLTGNSQPGPAPQARPTHHTSSQPRPRPAPSSSRASHRHHHHLAKPTNGSSTRSRPSPAVSSRAYSKPVTDGLAHHGQGD